ncbi:MAG: DnaD domain protein [Firmicutes bacterium]|jgi:DNA replication protein DnaD|nr:DnaD domain protein [Bacillota bacterium]
MADPDMQDVFQLYQRKVALLSSAQKEKLCAAHDEGMSPFVIGCAILRAKQEQRLSRMRGKNKHISFNYIYRIIEDWMNHGITTEEAFLTYWEAVNEDKQKMGKRGDTHVQSSPKKVTRQEYTYTTPPKQNKEFFPFLDE